MIYRLVESFQRIYNIQDMRMADNKFKDNIFLQAGKLLCRSGFFVPLGCLLTRIGLKKIYGGLARWALAVKAEGANLP
jgi:hypothetical protein